MSSRITFTGWAAFVFGASGFEFRSAIDCVAHNESGTALALGIACMVMLFIGLVGLMHVLKEA